MEEIVIFFLRIRFFFLKVIMNSHLKKKKIYKKNITIFVFKNVLVLKKSLK
jgi:hypothetical protein